MNDTENYIVEFCPHCETENEIRWDIETEGYEAFCPHCGKRIMICSECLRAEDNELQKCDWFKEKCFRCKSNKIGIFIGANENEYSSKIDT